MERIERPPQKEEPKKEEPIDATQLLYEMEQYIADQRQAAEEGIEYEDPGEAEEEKITGETSSL